MRKQTTVVVIGALRVKDQEVVSLISNWVILKTFLKLVIVWNSALRRRSVVSHITVGII